MRKIWLILFLSLLLACCTRKQKHAAPAWPGDYWEKAGAAKDNPDSLEQLLVDYLYVTANHPDSATCQEAWRELARVFPDEVPLRLAVDYMWHDDSPLYNPELLSEYLAATAAAFPEGDLRGRRAAYLHERVGLNMPGTQVADLALRRSDGTGTTLHVAVKGSATVLFFYDAECEHCAEVADTLAILSDRGPKVVAVSVLNGLRQLPSDWANYEAVGGEEAVEQSFYLPALPSLYYLDSSGTVLRRDFTIR